MRVLVDEETCDAFDAFDPSPLQGKTQVFHLPRCFSYATVDFSAVSIDQKHYAVARKGSRQRGQLIQPSECGWQLHEVEMQTVVCFRSCYYQLKWIHCLRGACDTCEHSLIVALLTVYSVEECNWVEETLRSKTLF